VLSSDSFVNVSTGLLLGGSVVLCWWYTWGTWRELRTDWRDFREAGDNARANRNERRAVARGRVCHRCGVGLSPRRLHRAVRTSQPEAPGAKWVYRCRCGELTVYDSAGQERYLDHTATG
jgi:hypothetical protein